MVGLDQPAHDEAWFRHEDAKVVDGRRIDIKLDGQVIADGWKRSVAITRPPFDAAGS
ncbi:hypothetical protein [Sphingomonas bacterium]|uniref:hypothetical protein n=1 Tax=Sphingomonas bacterium TaxID=1895847 RepID=UPI001575DDF8|nr:hypothetical protein [Sphingomonas bacterium]